MILDRRNFMGLAGAAALTLPLSTKTAIAAATPNRPLGILDPRTAPRPDYHLTIAPINHEIAPGHIIKTLAYNNQSPGPLVRLKEGRSAIIQITNNTDHDEIVHWHGLFLPSDVDGAAQQGSPMIPPGGSKSYGFIPLPSGNRWYHSHAGSGGDFTKGTYSGLYGSIYIDPKHEPGRYDREVFLNTHEWDAQIVGNRIVHHSGTFNGRKLGHGEPIRVKEGERVMFRILNSGPTAGRSFSLPGHKFEVVAMDGNPVPRPLTLDNVNAAPGERIDVIVEMNNPGIWVMADRHKEAREKGLGIVIEYAHATGDPVWVEPPKAARWSYVNFARKQDLQTYTPDKIFDLTFKEVPGKDGVLSRWTINGKSWPDTERLIVEEGKRYRMIFRNETNDMHPMHLHRHNFEVTNFMGTPTSGLIKDVLTIPMFNKAEVDFIADDPGLSLMHCHMTSHMENGFMALIEYK